MIDDSSKTPTDQLYNKGVPIRVSRKVDSSVDWMQRCDAPQEVQQAAKAAMTHYHYEDLSHLLLCQQIREQDNTSRFDDLTEAIAQHTKHKMGAWGKYMAQTEGGGKVSPELRDFYNMLYREQDPLSVILAITTLDKANHAVFQETRGDGLYQSVTGVITDTSEEQFPQLTDQLQPILMEKSVAERKGVMRKLAQYIDLVGMVVVRHDGTFQHLGSSGEQVLYNIGDDVKRFYNDIGLTDGIF